MSIGARGPITSSARLRTPSSSTSRRIDSDRLSSERISPDAMAMRAGLGRRLQHARTQPLA